jgi:hypothetical protein
MSFLSSTISYVATNPAIPLGIGILILLVYIFYLDHKIVLLTRGANGASLEEVIRMCIASTKKIEERNERITEHAALLDQKLSHSIRNVETIRYKAYEVNGSNQSFSVALVNENGNGVIISSLHSHDRMSTFAKPVSNYESAYELTEEEQTVLNDAKTAHKTLSL